jgi:signal transduction histidine kinase
MLFVPFCPEYAQHMDRANDHEGRKGLTDTAPTPPAKKRKTPRYPRTTPPNEPLTTMTHELRTPLNALLGFAQLLLDPARGEPLTARQQHYAEQILATGHTMSDIIEATLDMALLHLDRVQLHYRRVAPKTLVRETTDQMAALAMAKQQHLVLTIAPHLPTITVDRQQVQRILLNLVGNAIKYAPSGSTIEVGAQPGADGTTDFFVRDQGPGIAKKYHALIFEPFSQLADAGTHHQLGVGLGLALAAEVTRLHQGTIWVESAARKGSTFWVRLPNSPPKQNG